MHTRNSPTIARLARVAAYATSIIGAHDDPRRSVVGRSYAHPIRSAVLCTTNVEYPRALRGFLISDFSLAQAFMPGETAANDLVLHALLGRNDLGGGSAR